MIWYVDGTRSSISMTSNRPSANLSPEFLCLSAYLFNIYFAFEFFPRLPYLWWNAEMCLCKRNKFSQIIVEKTIEKHQYRRTNEMVCLILRRSNQICIEHTIHAHVFSIGFTNVPWLIVMEIRMGYLILFCCVGWLFAAEEFFENMFRMYVATWNWRDTVADFFLQMEYRTHIAYGEHRSHRCF